ncbi:MAG: GyrI-like domain-containing protein [Armatimonadetes bacterium]|nr:GyrI-like domain-containing protein [Armatimonadota bacterium]
MDRLCAAAGHHPRSGRSGSPDQVDPARILGLWHTAAEGECRQYLVGVQVASGAGLPDGLTAVTVPAGRYLRAVQVGDVGQIGSTYAAIQQWVEMHPHELGPNRGAPVIEVYDTRQDVDDGYQLEVFQPLG